MTNLIAFDTGVSMEKIQELRLILTTWLKWNQKIR